MPAPGTMGAGGGRPLQRLTTCRHPGGTPDAHFTRTLHLRAKDHLRTPRHEAIVKSETTQRICGGSGAGPRERAPWPRGRLRLQGLGTGRTPGHRPRTFPRRSPDPAVRGAGAPRLCRPGTWRGRTATPHVTRATSPSPAPSALRQTRHGSSCPYRGPCPRKLKPQHAPS